jgi:hypothetical protein
MFVEDQPHCGRYSTNRTDENVENVHQAFLADRCRTIDEISEITDVSWRLCRRILTEKLMMKRVAEKFVICRDLQEELKSDPHFLTKVVTDDESWC